MATSPGSYGNKMTEEKSRINWNFFDIVTGGIKDYDYIHKYGRNPAVSGTAPLPVCVGGIYQMPTTGAPLEILSDDADDTLLGSGARQVSIQGLDGNFSPQVETVDLAGLTPVNLTKTFTRIFRVKVLNGGTYPTQASWTQHGTITLRIQGGGATWAILDEQATDRGHGQSQIGCYTVPRGKTCVMLGFDFSMDSNNEVTLYLNQRRNCNNITEPFDSFRVLWQHDGVVGGSDFKPKIPFYAFPEYTDLVFMAQNTSGAMVTIDFEMVVIDNSILRPDQLNFIKNH
jgi:hypothetical protein